MPNILITGANGQVGQELSMLSAGYPNLECTFLDKSQLDISNENEVETLIKKHKPNYVINAGAYTAVDKAETDQEKAYLVNHIGPQNLASQCKKHNVWLLHISSDYVYHHNPGRALRENDVCKPQGVYAKSKLAGDQAIIQSGCDFSILRTSWVYSSVGNNFVKTMLKYGREREELSIVSDQNGTPTYAKDIAHALLLMIIKIEESGPSEEFKDVFNFGNTGLTNWAQFAARIFELKNIECGIKKVSTEAYNAPASRPKWSLLDKSKAQRVWNISLKTWDSSLQECLTLLP